MIVIAAVVITAVTTWAASHLIERTGEPVAPAAPANLASPAFVRTPGVVSLAFEQPAAVAPRAASANNELRWRQL